MTQRAGVFKRAATLVLAAAALSGCEHLLYYPPIALAIAPVWMPLRSLEAGIQCEPFYRMSGPVTHTRWPALNYSAGAATGRLQAIDESTPRSIGNGFTSLGGVVLNDLPRIEAPPLNRSGFYLSGPYHPLSIDPSSPKLLLQFGGYGAREIELRSDASGVVRDAAVLTHFGFPEPDCYHSRPLANPLSGPIVRLSDGRHAILHGPLRIYPAIPSDAPHDRVVPLEMAAVVNPLRECETCIFDRLVVSASETLTAMSIRWPHADPAPRRATLHELLPEGWRDLATFDLTYRDNWCTHLDAELICIRLPEGRDRSFTLRRLSLSRAAERSSMWTDAVIPDSWLGGKHVVGFTARRANNGRPLLYLLLSGGELSEIRVLSLQ